MSVRLTYRLLIFNLLLVFFPVGSMLYLDTYEKQMLVRIMVQQGRTLAAALEGAEDLQGEALRILENMAGRQNARIRVTDAEGVLLADSSAPELLPSPWEPAAVKEDVYLRSADLSLPESMGDIRENWLYRAAVYPLNLLRRLLFPPAAPLASADVYTDTSRLDGPEIRAALEGRYGAYTRYSVGGQRSVNLYSAFPVFREGDVAGTVLVSRSTFRILQDLYDLRLDMVRVFLLSLLAAVLLSILLARTITVPVRKLRDQAEDFLDHRGRVKGEFGVLKNRDEIGDLSLSLNTLSRRLEEYIRYMDSFSSDLSHELKNPVASLLNAADLCREAPVEERERFLSIIEDEGRRINRLIGDLRDMSRADVRPGEESREIDPRPLAEGAAVWWNGRGGLQVIAECSDCPVILGDEDRLMQCLNNLIDNAAGFSPAGEPVLVRLSCRGDGVEISVLDRGPGIRQGNEDKLLQRFFTDRPGDKNREHSGLGLSIVNSIARAYGGSLSFANREGGGAVFTLRFPAAGKRRGRKSS